MALGSHAVQYMTAPQFPSDNDSQNQCEQLTEGKFVPSTKEACPSGQLNRVPQPVPKTENTGLTPYC